MVYRPIALGYSGVMTKRLISGKLRALRRSRGLTIPQLARQVGVSEITVRTWQAGKYSPNSENLTKLATVLGVPASELATSTCPTCGQTVPEGN